MFGASSNRRPTAPPASADALAELVLPDHDENDVRLGALWHERPAVLVWLRHYG